MSICSLRIAGVLAPPPVPLDFSGAEDPPTAPTLVVLPADGLRPGDAIEITGSGFTGSSIVLSFCATQPADEASPAPGVGAHPFGYCLPIPQDGSEVALDDAGGFVLQTTVGSFESASRCVAAEAIDCPPPMSSGWAFELQAWGDPGGLGAAPQPPFLSPLPVRVPFTP